MNLQDVDNDYEPSVSRFWGMVVFWVCIAAVSVVALAGTIKASVDYFDRRAAAVVKDAKVDIDKRFARLDGKLDRLLQIGERYARVSKEGTVKKVPEQPKGKPGGKRVAVVVQSNKTVAQAPTPTREKLVWKLPDGSYAAKGYASRLGRNHSFVVWAKGPRLSDYSAVLAKHLSGEAINDHAIAIHLRRTADTYQTPLVTLPVTNAPRDYQRAEHDRDDHQGVRDGRVGGRR